MVSSEPVVCFQHPCLRLHVRWQRVERAQSLACLFQEVWVGVYVQVYQTVVQVPYGFAQAFQPHHQDGVFVAILGYLLGEPCLCKGLAAYHEVLRSKDFVWILPPVFNCPLAGCDGFVCPSETASLRAFLRVLHAAIVGIGRVGDGGINVVLQEMWTVYLRVAVHEEKPFTPRNVDKSVADA